MDLSEIDPFVILARGQYATVNGAYKDTMEEMQSLANQACELIRKGLNETESVAERKFTEASEICEKLWGMTWAASELKKQKDAIYQTAWGDK